MAAAVVVNTDKVGRTAMMITRQFHRPIPSGVASPEATRLHSMHLLRFRLIPAITRASTGGHRRSAANLRRPDTARLVRYLVRPCSLEEVLATCPWVLLRDRLCRISSTRLVGAALTSPCAYHRSKLSCRARRHPSRRPPGRRASTWGKAPAATPCSSSTSSNCSPNIVSARARPRASRRWS